MRNLYLETKTSEEQRKVSLLLLAGKMNCTPFDVKNLYFENLKESNFSYEELVIAKKDWKKKKKDEGDFFNINPKNTCASLLQKWTKEYIKKNYGKVEEELNQHDIWKLRAFKSFEENDYESSRVFAENSYSLNPNDIDINLFLLNVLVIKLKNVSLHKLKTNYERAQQLYKEINLKEKSGIFNFEEKHKKKITKWASNNYEFIEYINDLSFKIDNNWEF